MLQNMWIPATQDLRLFSPELALIGTIMAVLIVPLIGGRSGYLVAAVAMIGALLTIMLTGLAATTMVAGGHAGMSPPSATPMLITDNFGLFFKFFLMMFLVLVIWLWMVGFSTRRTSPPQHGVPEFFVLLLTSALGMALMVSTLNLLLIVIAIETASLPSYAIVAGDKRSRLSAEASLKYVLFGAATSAIMIYGVSLLYGYFGTLDLPTIAARIASDSAIGILPTLGLFALCVGIAFKISAVPFHFWCPDVFEGAPIEVTTWLSVASKAAGLGLLLRIVNVFMTSPETAASMSTFSLTIGVFAALTCTVGNLSALRQESVKRILAYSSIAHAGYMMMAAAIFVRPEQLKTYNLGLAAVIAYLFVYLIMNLGAFGVTAIVYWQTGSDKLTAFTGLGRRAPWLAAPLAACLFSLVGLPPLGGFAAKWFLIYYLGEAASLQPWLWGLVVVAVINTAISLYYYVRIIRQMYLTDDERLPPITAPFGGLALVNGCALMLLLLGTIFIDRLGDRAKTYASNLFASSPATSMQPTKADASKSFGGVEIVE